MSRPRPPSATSLMVKSNSLRATKSTAARPDQALPGLDRDLGADQADAYARIDLLDHLRGLHVRPEGGRRGVHHHEVAVPDLGNDVLERQVDPAAHRSASSPRRARPAARARSDTRRSAPRASSGSARRRRHRIRRRREDAGTVFSLVIPHCTDRVEGAIAGQAVAVAPASARWRVAKLQHHSSKAEHVAQRQHEPDCRGSAACDCAGAECSTRRAAAVIADQRERRPRAAGEQAADHSHRHAEGDDRKAYSPAAARRGWCAASAARDAPARRGSPHRRSCRPPPRTARSAGPTAA